MKTDKITKISYSLATVAGVCFISGIVILSK